MGSTFSGLSTALSSLYTQRRALDVTGQNVANANTEGYTRQRVEMQATSATPVPAVHSVHNGAGGGVTVSDVSRLRDSFLESRGRAEHAQASYLSAQQSTFTRLENVFAEPSDTALAAQLGDFWAGWGDVANQPKNEAVRAQLLERGAVVADGLRVAHDALSAQWSSTRVQLDSYASDVNSAADAVALLNQTIMQQKSAGLPSNELADQRDLRLMELAELTGATTASREDGTVDVYVGGSSLVTGGVARHLVVTGARQLATESSDKVQFRWDSPTGLVASVSGGTLAAGLDTLGTTIPEYAGKLDQVAAALADKVNTQHRLGYGMDGVAPAGDLFVNTAGGAGITARTIGVGITNPRQLGVSASPGAVDGSNADKLADVMKLADGPDAAYRSLVVGLGVSAQTAQRRADIQLRVAADMDTLRSADAGVNLDEEMTNMISFQRAYEAAARVLTSVDEMLDVLINRTGLVGR
ncbi:MAG TPA: flagellar hook-associated protein FlgK [Pilimelia sp.]|nr:flagellar hook-associated protein FlgK [Pilimelia sp.]